VDNLFGGHLISLLMCKISEESVSDCGVTVTKILNGGGGLQDDLINGASQLFPRAAIFSAYGTDHRINLLSLNNEKQFSSCMG
jgi:hypothetical protein